MVGMNFLSLPHSLFHPFIRAEKHQMPLVCEAHRMCTNCQATVTLTCVRIDVPQGPVQQCSNHKCCDAILITVRVSRPWKISIMIRNQCILWVNQHHMLQFYICFTSIIRKAENQLTNSEDKKWILTKYTIFVTCKYFLKRKMKFSDFQDTFSLQFTLSIKLTKKSDLSTL